jgi:hypothetical protein
MKKDLNLFVPIQQAGAQITVFESSDSGIFPTDDGASSSTLIIREAVVRRYAFKSVGRLFLPSSFRKRMFNFVASPVFLFNLNQLFMRTFDSMIRGVIFVFLVGVATPDVAFAQTTNETIATGAFIVNMGITPQNDGNGLKPYGMLYDLLHNHQVPIKWVIAPGKARDGIDFTHNGKNYRGGTFIIPAEYRTSMVNSRISFWQGQGVVGETSVSAITVPVWGTIKASPRWAINPDKADVAINYLNQAGIPGSAYYIKEAPSLGNCDDVFLVPHDDQISSGNLVTWNQNKKGYIWVGCKSGSILETEVGHFLSTTGVEGFDGNWGNPSVTYGFNDEPPMQFMGNTAHEAAQAGGANTSYQPFSAWRATTRQLIRITGQTRVCAAYGPGFGNTNYGWVMMSAGHNYGDPKKNISTTSRVALTRAMLNFSYMSVLQKAVNVAINIPATLPGGTGTALTYTLTPSGGSNSTKWSSSCGGTFSPNTTSATVTYTPPTNATSCVISVKVTDGCGRVAFDSKQVMVGCLLTAQPVATSVSCNGGSNGAINMTLTGGAAPYSWNWSRVSPAGTGSGTGTNITGLSTGTYNVTVSSPAGCSATFSALISQPTLLNATATAVNPGCFGQTGSVNLALSGGTPAYTYSWTGPSGFTATTQNLSNRPAGTYNVTVTDTRGCTRTASATIVAPTAFTVTLTSKTNVSCNGGTNGTINITPSGGAPGYTYKWNNNATTEDRSGLAAGTYTVTVTDNNMCTATLSTTITQPAALTVIPTSINVTCPATANAPLNSNGAISLAVTGGTPVFTYSWTTANGTGLVPTAQNQTGLGLGTYNVLVIDANGCTATKIVTLTNINPNPVPPTGILNN